MQIVGGIENELLQRQPLALVHKLLLLRRERALVMSVDDAAVAAIDERIEPMTAIHSAHRLNRGLWNHIHTAVIALLAIPCGGSVEHDKWQTGVQPAKHRHHSGRRARSGNGEQQPIVEHRVEHLNSLSRNLRIGIK